MMILNFSGKAEDPGPEWTRGFDDALHVHHKGWLSTRGRKCYNIRKGIYGNGYAEGLITHGWRCWEFWQGLGENPNSMMDCLGLYPQPKFSLNLRMN